MTLLTVVDHDFGRVAMAFSVQQCHLIISVKVLLLFAVATFGSKRPDMLLVVHSNHSESTSSLGWQTDDMNVASESASSQKSASTLPRRSSGKLIERLCSRGDTFKRAIDIYNSVKDQEQFKEKSCLPNVCALIASERYSLYVYLAL